MSFEGYSLIKPYRALCIRGEEGWAWRHASGKPQGHGVQWRPEYIIPMWNPKSILKTALLPSMVTAAHIGSSQWRDIRAYERLYKQLPSGLCGLDLMPTL